MQSLPPAFAAMAPLRRFIAYKIVPRNGKAVKLPCDLQGNIINAHDSTKWHTADEVLHAQQPLGFVFTADLGMFFLDIDHCYADGQWSELSTWLLNAFPGAAVEVSSSGTGLHIIGRGTAPPHACKNTALGLELYTDERFVALTGTHASGDAGRDFTPQLEWLVANYFAPSAGLDTDTGADGWTTEPTVDWRGPLDDDDLIRRAMRSSSTAAVFGGKATFADLWTRNVDALAVAFPDSEREFDESAADMALASHLMFWTGKNCERVYELMQLSMLKRDKWDSHGSYLRGSGYTISNAYNLCTRVLQDKEPEPINISYDYDEAEPSLAEAKLVDGATMLSGGQQMALFSGCTYVIDAHRVLMPGGRLVRPEQFRATFGGYSFPMDKENQRVVRNAWEAFTESQVFRSPRADGTCFRPDLPYGTIVTDAGRTRVNTWWPVDVPRRQGDISPFMQHLNKVLPDLRDQTILLSYMAGCVQYKGHKFQWAPLLQGVEGNGKTLFTRCVAEAVGKRYVHWPKAKKLSKDFNSWMVGKLFYGVEDIYAPGHATDVIEELKPMITGGDGFEIEGKGIDQISTEICGNFMFNSNHKDALRKTRNDRRFCIFYTHQQSFADLKRDGMDGDYFPKLYDWLKYEDGYAVVAEYLHTYPIPEEFGLATLMYRAPLTSSTESAIALSIGLVEQNIQEAIEQGQPGFANGWVSSVMLNQLLEHCRMAGKYPPSKRRELMQSLGYEIHPGLNGGRVNNIVEPDKGKPILYISANHPTAHMTVAADIAKIYTDNQK